MENASKALLMAGGILIALLIISALAMMFVSFSDYQNAVDASKKSSQVAEFNNQYEPYNKKDLTLMELKSVYNKIKSNNKKYPEYKIETNIEDVYSDINDDFSGIEEEDKINKNFQCINVEYNKEGRICKIEFKENT